jgi:hypothetical protein
MAARWELASRARTEASHTAASAALPAADPAPLER